MSIARAISVRPRLRTRELSLLVVGGIALAMGWASLASEQAGRLTFGDPTVLGWYLAVIVAVHGVFVFTGRRTDQLLLPAVAMLGGLSLLLMQRLPQTLVVQSFGGNELGLAQLQLAWLVLAFAIVAVVATVVRRDDWLRHYKYTWAAAGIALLLLVFLSAYLAENRSLLSDVSTRLGPIRLPPLPYLAPMVAMWGLALAIVVVQKDLGAALLFFAVFLALLYIATA